MTPRISAVVFDMDGLMLDTEPLYKAAWQSASSELGYDLDDIAYQRLIGRPTDDCYRELVAQFGSVFPLSEFRTLWAKRWHATATTQGIPAKPGLVELLAFLEAKKIPAGVATSSDDRYADISLRHAGLLGRFQTVVTVDQVARGKPAPDLYVEAARRLRVDASQCLVFEDSDVGVLAARAAGMVPVLIPDLKLPSEAGLAAAHCVLTSLHDALPLAASFIAGDEPAL